MKALKNETWCEFEHVHRHKDKVLRDKLEPIRRNDITNETLEYFNKRCIDMSSNQLRYVVLIASKYITHYLSKIPGKEFTWLNQNFREMIQI